eukprot:Phypoly_transcript_01436.p1 GENE.Phypoly_transcript_01436~~Phypoly_transcript_01436.p1  ORF type:complete len:783 (+),score=107.81 Phypoly_transcript_01436:144-2492(+)
MDHPPRSSSPLTSAWKEEEEFRNASRKTSSPDYSSSYSDSTEESESETESEEEPYSTRGRKKKPSTSKLNISRGTVSSDSDIHSPNSTKSFDEVYTHRKRASIDFHVSPILRNKTNTSPGSPTQPRKTIFNKHGIKPIDLGGLREAPEEPDMAVLRGQRRELSTLMEKQKTLTQSISDAKEGYNDDGESIDVLQESLNKLNTEISSLENLILASPLASPHVLSSTASPRPNSPTSRKFSQELKMELRQLDSRMAPYTSPRRQVKGNTWQVDNTETESEREKRMTDRFDKINVMLARHGPDIDFSEIKLSDRVGQGNTSVVFEGVWNEHRVVVKQIHSSSVAHEKLLDEVNRLQRLHHPNMVLCMGACKSPPALVFEFMNLGNLNDVLHVHTVKMDTLLLLKMAKELASVLCHLHNQKTVHGNLWSKCIFISQVDRHKSIRLGGLHLNKDLYTLQDGRDRNPMAPRWRAPELTRGGKITEKADVYGYGIVLWEMVTNKVPFRKFDDVTAAAKAAYENLRPKISGTCPRILRRLITRCWAPNPDDRPSFIEILKFFNHVEGKLFFIPEKGGIWTLDKEQEKEQEQMRETRFKTVVEFLKKKDIMLQFHELKLREKVGEGSFAKVWEGMWGEYRVAVKKLRNVNISTNFFIREVANLQKSHHPNVVLFMGACAQPPCIVTEYMAGGTLYTVLHESRVKLDLLIFLKFARDIALGMAHLHSLNILHRDLTSKNILLDEYQNVKISDFGLSREVEVEMTLAGICNPRWRPPEITKGVTNYDGKQRKA